MALLTSPCASPGTSRGMFWAWVGPWWGAPLRGSHCTLACRDLAKGGTVEYTNEKHTLDLAPNSTERRQLASLLEGTSDQSV